MLRPRVAPEVKAAIARPAVVDGAKARGFILYPGKLTQVETFRVGCIGAIGSLEMQQAVHAVGETLREMGIPTLPA